LNDLGIPVPEALERLGPRPDYTEMPAPDDQPNMPRVGVSPSTAPTSSPTVSPAPAPTIPPNQTGLMVGVAGLIAIGAAAVLIVLLWQRRRGSAG
jgi:hypothetical protein